MSENECKTGKGSYHKEKSLIADACNWEVEGGHENAKLEKRASLSSVLSLHNQKLLGTFNISSLIQQVFNRISIPQMSTLPLGIKLHPLELNANLSFFVIIKYFGGLIV